MRNLKRVLSLTLASVMLMGMMVVGSNAAAGYDDVSETDNVEAIEVLQAIEVMVGDERGFGPERPVNRAEMAVVMGKLLSLDYNYYTALCPFTDVYDWAQGWVGACYANKIVSGRGDGIYDPGATVTAVEAASMLMRALGYFQYQNDYTDGFELSTVTQGKKIGIFDNVGSSASEPMTRNQVAQMVLNALQSAVVEPDGNTINLTTPDGSVITGKVNYVSVTSKKTFATAISRTEATSIGSTNDGYIVELGERLYDGDLKLYEYTDDEFMRPSRTWEYDGTEIGTYMKKENIREEYTAGVSKRTLYDLLGRTILQDYKFAYYVDGVLMDGSAASESDSDERVSITATDILSRETSDFGKTGRGVLTQVFVDIERETIDITSINTYLAQATVDYNKTTETVSLNVYGSITKTNDAPITYRSDTYNKQVSVIDEPKAENVKQDQYLLVNVSGKDSAEHTRKTLSGYDVVAIDDVEIMSDSTLTKFSKRDSDSKTDSDEDHALFKSVVTGGTEYKNSTMAYYSDDVLDLYDDDRLVNKTYNIYLDKYGYAIGIDLHEGDDNYVFITGFDPSGSNIAYGNADAAAIFTDGTMKVIKVDTKATNINIDKVDSEDYTDATTIDDSYFEQWRGTMWANKYALNRWYTYTVDNDGVYTLHPAQRMLTTEVVKNTGLIPVDGLTIKTGNVRIDENAAVAVGPNTNKNGAGSGKTGTRAYGNDDSIYIVVNTGDTDSVDNSSSAKVITEVSGVYTGVQNVEIDVESKPNGDTGAVIAGTALYDSIYTVYDKNNYIIASVIIGEAKGGDANYAYILTAATSEERLTSDGYTRWTFDAIVDGKITTLTTSNKFSNVISKLQPGHIQELRYTGDYVSGVKTPDKAEQYWDYANATADIATNAYMNDKVEIYDVGHDYGATTRWDCAAGNSHNGTDTPFIDDEGHLRRDATTGAYQANDLKIIGNTLRFRTEDSATADAFKKDSGLAIRKDAPAVVLQRVAGENRKLEFSSVAQAIAELGDPNKETTQKEFCGRIVAVLDSAGAAKWVVFISDTEVKAKDGGTVNNQQQDVDGVAMENGRLIVTANTNDGDGNLVRTMLVRWLEANGYTLLSITPANNGVEDDSANFLIVAMDASGKAVTINSDLKCMVRLKVNGASDFAEYRLGSTIKSTENGGTGYIVSANAIVAGHAGAGDPAGGGGGGTVAGTGYTAGDYTVQWADDGKNLRTNVFTMTPGAGGTAGYYKAGDTAKILSANGGGSGTWGEYTVSGDKKHVALTTVGSDSTFEVDANMAGATVAGGFFKVSMSGQNDQYITASNTTKTTAFSTTLTGNWAKTADGDYIAVNASGQIDGDNLDGGGTPIDKDIEIVDDGYYMVTIPAAETVLTSMKVEITTPAAGTKVYYQEDDEVEMVITISGTADAATAKTITVTNATFSGTDGDDLATVGTPTAMTSAKRTDDTTLTFTPTQAAVSGVYKATLKIGTDDVTFTMPS